MPCLHSIYTIYTNYLYYFTKQVAERFCILSVKQKCSLKRHTHFLTKVRIKIKWLHFIVFSFHPCLNSHVSVEISDADLLLCCKSLTWYPPSVIIPLWWVSHQNLSAVKGENLPMWWKSDSLMAYLAVRWHKLGEARNMPGQVASSLLDAWGVQYLISSVFYQLLHESICCSLQELLDLHTFYNAPVLSLVNRCSMKIRGRVLWRLETWSQEFKMIL